MRTTRRALLATASASTALGAGCVGGLGSTDEPATLRVAEHDELGEILVDGDGETLYMFDPDPRGEGESACEGGCLDAWPALTVEGEPTPGDDVTAELSTFERADDGSMQVAANGWPLYYWQSDESPGDATGQGVNDAWWVLRPDGTPVRPDVRVGEHEELGEILVDTAGRTLYMFDSDEQSAGESSCSGGCLDAWPALTVEDGDPLAGRDVEATLTTFERDDGSTQVAADGWPLYYYASDEESGDATGQGANDVWWVLRPDGAVYRGEDGS